MPTLSTVLPERIYRRAVAAMSRRVFRLEPGAAFDSLGWLDTARGVCGRGNAMSWACPGTGSRV